jgi:hypothetical protein
MGGVPADPPRLELENNMWLEHLTGMVAGLAFWAFLTAIIIVPVVLRYRDRGRMHETLRVAYEKGQPVPPELIAAMQNSVATRAASTPERDLRRGILLVAIGLGFAGLGYGLWYGLMSVNEIAAYVSGGSTAGFGAIPGLIGVAYLILWATRRHEPKA